MKALRTVREINKSGRFRIRCTHCRMNTSFYHIHDVLLSNGEESTHIAGTERYVCTICNLSIFKPEGERVGLEFPLDS